MIKISLQINKYRGILRPILKYFSETKFMLIRKPIFWIFLLALFLRLFKLGEFPVGLHVDEVKVGWNAFSILKTGLDDHGNFFSLYYDSFGDYRPAGVFYTAIPFILIFGKTIFAIRFSSALIGAMTVIPLYLLTNIIFTKRNGVNRFNDIGSFASLMLATSAWHIEVSRATSEVAISAFFGLFGIYYFIKYIKNSKKIYAYISITMTILATFLYHSIRLLAPLFYLFIYLYFYKYLSYRKNNAYAFVSVSLIFILSIFFSSTTGGFSRLNQVSILKDVDVTYEITRIRQENLSGNVFNRLIDNKIVVYSRKLFTNYATYFSGDFLIGSSAKPYRYTTPGAGLLGYMEVFAFFVGLWHIIKNRNGYLPIIFLLISPIPAALTWEDSPNLHRSLFMIPFMATISGYGLAITTNYFIKKYFKSVLFIKSILILAFVFFNTFIFFHMYFYHSYNHKPFLKDYVVDNPTYRNSGTTELARRLNLISTDYELIVVANFPDNPYPWYAFFNDIEPGLFNKKTYNPNSNERIWQNIVFSDSTCPSDFAFDKYNHKKMLVIDSWACGYDSQIKAGLPAKVTEKIYRSDGGEAFVFMERS